ncbi:MAG: 2-oxoglutarate dehydrogenase complex dihydrolipoyllysine-residue succinyltransferase [Pirellulales bacterium]
MSIELRIPELGESIREVQIGRWLKKEGDRVEENEDVVELETDKASMELPAPAPGIVAKIIKHEGDSVAIGDAIAVIDEDGQAAASDEQAAENNNAAPPKSPAATKSDSSAAKKTGEPPAAATIRDELPAITPSARRALRELGVRPEEVKPSGKRLRPEDVLRHVEEQAQERDDQGPISSLEELVPMSLIRRRIAERLVEAQKTAALLTTFNEIDMSAVMEIRQAHRERFQDRYGVKLGFMSFFVKATIDALQQFPELNAEIRGSDILYRSYYHIGIAIGAQRGLVVPVLRRAERMSFADIEQSIGNFARRAEENKLKPHELQGGTFTITNGGVFGSLLSTPIVNPPQSGVLGMHAIQERPVAREGQVVIRPMMYVALTYDHRLVDGRAAVSFLRRIKETIEEPVRMLIET